MWTAADGRRGPAARISRVKSKLAKLPQTRGLGRIEVIPLRTLPEVRRGADLAHLVAAAARREKTEIRSGDVVVITQKIVSKSEGRLVRLRRVKPSLWARAWAPRIGRDARFLEVVLAESGEILRASPRALIAVSRHGFVCANAGVDQSNIPGRGVVSCLPRDPDASARRFVAALRKLTGARVACLLTDTWGRPWRMGQLNFAIGAAGLRVLQDWRGRRDSHGHTLRATILAVADELAAAAGLAMGKTARVPVVLVRGYNFRAGRDTAHRLLRPAKEDLFR